MKKTYSKPILKKLIKGAASDYKDFQEVNTEFHKISDSSIFETTKEERDQSCIEVLLKLTPKRDLAYLEKHYKSDVKPKSGNYILKNESVILKLFEVYKDEFRGETKELWFQRFIYPCEISVNHINVDHRVKLGNNRLILIAILAAIQDSDSTDFEYNNFVLDRFGIKNFKKARSDHKDKPKYKEIYDKCKKII
jgi:hypothetical protein